MSCCFRSSKDSDHYTAARAASMAALLSSVDYAEARCRTALTLTRPVETRFSLLGRYRSQRLLQPVPDLGSPSAGCGRGGSYDLG